MYIPALFAEDELPVFEFETELEFELEVLLELVFDVPDEVFDVVVLLVFPLFAVFLFCWLDQYQYQYIGSSIGYGLFGEYELFELFEPYEPFELFDEP